MKSLVYPQNVASHIFHRTMHFRDTSVDGIMKVKTWALAALTSQGRSHVLNRLTKATK